MIDFGKKPLFLAPLAGFSDLPLRSVVKEFGCDVTISEMISANALAYDSAKSIKMIQKASNETPYIVQIAGNDLENVKKAVEILNSIDGIDGIDLNCGCPVPKVVRQESGSALLKNLDLLKRVLQTIKNTSNKRLTTAKIRLGFDSKIHVDVAKACEEAGVDYVAVHGRTRAGGYTANVDYDAIGQIKETVKIPVVANGDINAKNANDVLAQTKADALMIGRASIGNPWIFLEIKHGKSVDNDTKKRIIIAHFQAMIAHYGTHGLNIFRKHLHQYSKGMDGAAVFRDEINRINDEDKFFDKISSFF
ncbi:tRNA-dihydrouridine synthase B [Campylobacter majalis]|uniref:tRNA-dihydrouridine synthase n=1 Tax=Campylobacter majalis TaxID=2790656 RepID=A0ABM8Q9S4_9BACT|nr:tRNA-dihydrouridine synthase [Campylobacter majalis]CAD7289632.1 tRNA-dihydrouridine synthase B [Campylobacter majalis]